MVVIFFPGEKFGIKKPYDFLRKFFTFIYRSGFLKRDLKPSPNSHQKIWRTICLRTVALLGFISDIHRVLWVSANPVDVRNEPQQGTCPQAISSSNFQMWIWEVISIAFEKAWPVQIKVELFSITHFSWCYLWYRYVSTYRAGTLW